MKPIHGDTVSNDSCSSTSWTNSTETSRQTFRRLLAQHGTRIDRLFQDKYIPFKESKLLEKLVRTRALYEELRSQLLSSSLSTRSKDKHEVENNLEEASKSNIIALVDLVDKGVILKPKSLSDCCSCSHCITKRLFKNGLIKLRPKKDYIGGYLTSKSSIVSKHINREDSRLGVRFKTKNIKSDPCTSTNKYEEYFQRKSGEILNNVHPDQSKKLNRERIKKAHRKPKQPYFAESSKSSTVKSYDENKIKRDEAYFNPCIHRYLEEITHSKCLPCMNPTQHAVLLDSLPSDSSNQLKRNLLLKSTVSWSSNDFKQSSTKYRADQMVIMNDIKNTNALKSEKATQGMLVISISTEAGKHKCYVKETLSPRQDIKVSSDCSDLKGSIPCMCENLDCIQTSNISWQHTKSEKPDRKGSQNLSAKRQNPVTKRGKNDDHSLKRCFCTLKLKTKDINNATQNIPYIPDTESIATKVLEAYKRQFLKIRNTLFPCESFCCKPCNCISGGHKSQTLPTVVSKETQLDSAEHERRDINIEKCKSTCRDKNYRHIDKDSKRIQNMEALSNATNKSKCVLTKHSLRRCLCSFKIGTKTFENRLKPIMFSKGAIPSGHIIKISKTPSKRVSVSTSTERKSHNEKRDVKKPKRRTLKHAYTTNNRKTRSTASFTPRLLKTKKVQSSIVTQSNVPIQTHKQKRINEKLQTNAKNLSNHGSQIISDSCNCNNKGFCSHCFTKKSLCHNTNYANISASNLKHFYKDTLHLHKSIHKQFFKGINISPDKKRNFCTLQFHKKGKCKAKCNPVSDAMKSCIDNEYYSEKNEALKTSVPKLLKCSNTFNVPQPYECELSVSQQQECSTQKSVINVTSTTNLEKVTHTVHINSDSNNLHDHISEVVTSGLPHQDGDTGNICKCEKYPDILKFHERTSKKHREITNFSLSFVCSNYFLSGQKYKKKLTNDIDIKKSKKLDKLVNKAIMKHISLSKQISAQDKIPKFLSFHGDSSKILRQKTRKKLFNLPFQTPKPTQVYAVSKVTVAGTKLNPSKSLLLRKDSQRYSKSQEHNNIRYFTQKYLPNIISVSTISLKSNNIQSCFRESKFDLFQVSSTNLSLFNMTSTDTMQLKSEFSCEVNYSKNNTSSLVKIAQSNYPLILEQRQLCDLINCDSLIYPAQIIKPLPVNPQLTGVPSLLRRCFCTMNIQVSGKREPKNHDHKPYECEPGVCVPGTCDPLECQKLIIKQFKTRNSKKLVDSERNPKSSSTLIPDVNTNSKTKNIQTKVGEPKSPKIKAKRKLIGASTRHKGKSTGLTYQTYPRSAFPQSEKQTIHIGSTFSFDLELTKNISKKSRQSAVIGKHRSSSKYLKLNKLNKNKATKGYETRRLRESQSTLEKVRRRVSTATPTLKRCLCTLKLQKKGRQSKVKDRQAKDTSTPPKIKTDNKKSQPNKTKQSITTGTSTPPITKMEKSSLKAIEISPTTKLKQTKGTNSMADNKFSSSSTTFEIKKHIVGKHTHSKHVHTKTVTSNQEIEPAMSKDGRPTPIRRQSSVKEIKSSGSLPKHVVKIYSSLNVEIYKDSRSTTSTMNDRGESFSSKKYREPQFKERKPNMQNTSQDMRPTRYNNSYSGNIHGGQVTGKTSFLKRCFCTATLQGIKTKSPLKNPTSRKEKPVKTQTRRQPRALDPYECEPGVCVPGSCDPHECLKLIKKRQTKVKEKGSGPEVPKMKSTASFSSSKTSKAGITQSMLEPSPTDVAKDTKIKSKAAKRPKLSPKIAKKSASKTNSAVTCECPSRSASSKRSSDSQNTVVFKDDPWQDGSVQRDAVRIRSTLSFGIEFYREEQFPSFERVQAAAEAIKNTKEKMQDVWRGIKTKTKQLKGTEPSVHHRDSQTDGGIAPLLKRCFCTLKLQKKGEDFQHINKVKSPIHRGTVTPFSKRTADLHDRNIMTAYKFKTYPYKLEPYECEPGVCVPGECDPYECLKRIKRRDLTNRGSGTDYYGTRSISNMTSPARKHRHHKGQYTAIGKRPMGIHAVQSGVSRPERGTVSRLERRIISSPSSSGQSSARQAVKIGSNFSFNVEFYKDTQSDSASSPRQHHTIHETYERPRHVRHRHEKIGHERIEHGKPRHTVSRSTDGYSVSSKDRRTGRRKAARDTESQVLGHKMRSTGVGPFLKRCFCTLQLQKKGTKEPKTKPKTKPKSKPKTKKEKVGTENVSIGTETMKVKPVIHSVDKGTRTKKKYKHREKYSKLDPNECEPGVCIPGECDPYVCLERIKKRGKGTRSKQSGTGGHKSRSVSSAIVERKRKKPKRSQVQLGNRRRTSRSVSSSIAEEKISRAVRTRPPRERIERERLTYSPTSNSQRQAVRIGSSFSFNIEFYRDRSDTQQSSNIIRHHVEDRHGQEHVPHAKHYKRVVRRTGSGTRPKRIRSISSNYRKARLHNRDMQSQISTESRGSGTGPGLKRCFCTLKLQKIGKTQKKATAPIGTIYKTTGTNVRNQPVIKDRIVGREVGTVTKRRYHALEPYECEPGVCVPGECDPHECLKRINMRRRHSGTGMDYDTRSISSLTSRRGGTRSMKTQMYRGRGDMKNRRHVESQYKMGHRTESTDSYRVRQPPRLSRALENININNRQAVRLGSSFSFNVEFYKDTSNAGERVSIERVGLGRTGMNRVGGSISVPPCSTSICKEPTCTPIKCKTSSCSTRCQLKSQGTHGSGPGRYHRKLQAVGARTESTGSGVGPALKRCFCTLTLQRAEVKTTMNTVRTGPSVKDKKTSTKKKYLAATMHQLEPDECEPGVCVPGECDPEKCLERIKRRLVKRISRTSGTHAKRMRDFATTQFMPAFVSKKTQHQVDNTSKDLRIVEEPRFQMPFNRQTVGMRSNISFNIEFYREVSIPESSSIVEEEKEITKKEVMSKQKTIVIKPKSKKNKLTAETIPVEETDKSEKPKNRKIQVETLHVKDKSSTMEGIKRCFCTKHLLKSEKNEKDTKFANPITRCLCSTKAVTVGRVEIERSKSKYKSAAELLPNDTANTKSTNEPERKLSAAGTLLRCFCSQKLFKAKSEVGGPRLAVPLKIKPERNDYNTVIAKIENKLLPGTVVKSKSQQSSPKVVTASSNVQLTQVKTKEKGSGAKLPVRCFCTAKLLKANTKGRGPKVITVARLDRIGPISHFPPKEYWVQYQVQHPKLHKPLMFKNNAFKLDSKRSKIDSKKVETIMSYSPSKFHKTKSKTQADKCQNTENEMTLISQKVSVKCGSGACCKFCQAQECLNGKDINQGNMFFNDTQVNSTTNLPRIQGPLPSTSNLKKIICRWIQVFSAARKNKLKALRTTNSNTLLMDTQKCIEYTQNKGTEMSACQEKKNIRSNNTGLGEILVHKVPNTDANLAEKAHASVQANRSDIRLKNLEKQFPMSRVQYKPRSTLQVISADKSIDVVSLLSGYHNKTTCISGNSENKLFSTEQQTTNTSNIYKKDESLKIVSNSSHFHDKSTSKCDESLCKLNKKQTSFVYLDKGLGSKCDKTTFLSIKNITSKLNTNQIASKPSLKHCNTEHCETEQDKTMTFIFKPLSYHNKATFCNIQKPQNILDLNQKLCNGFSVYDKTTYCSLNKSQSKSTIKQKSSVTSKIHKKKESRTFITKPVRLRSQPSNFFLKNFVSSGESGDYQVAFLVTSSDLMEKLLLQNISNGGEIPCFVYKKKYLFARDIDKDSKLYYPSFVYKKKNALTNTYSKRHKTSCPCFLCRKMNSISKNYPKEHYISCPRISCKNKHVCPDNLKFYKIKKVTNDQNSRTVNDSQKCMNTIKIASVEDKLNLERRKKVQNVCISCPTKLNKACSKRKEHVLVKRSDAEKKQSKKKNLAQSKMRRWPDEKLKKKCHIKNRNFKSDMLVAETLLDIAKLGITSVRDSISIGCKAIIDPKCTYRIVKRLIFHPKTSWINFKKAINTSSQVATLNRIRMRLRSLSFVEPITVAFKDNTTISYLTRIKDPRKRIYRNPLRPHKVSVGCTNLYMTSLRNKPCFWLHYICPRFYPHYVGAVRLWRQLTHVFLFSLAVVVWSPCLVSAELCRAILCRLFC